MPMIPILFENDDLVAVNKPEGISSIPERTSAPSVVSRLAPLYKEKIYIVHRLDKDVSGVIVFAKNAEAHKALCEQFLRRVVEKRYIALVHGRLEESTGTIDKPLRQYGSGRMGIDEKMGKDSITRFELEEGFTNFSLVRLQPLTGRRHQLRVHLHAIGHPIVGDPLYGEKKVQRAYPRLMLHAGSLSFASKSGDKTVIEAPLPPSFLKIIEATVAI